MDIRIMHRYIFLSKNAERRRIINTMKKKLFVIMLAGMLAGSTVACSGSGDASSADNTQETDKGDDSNSKKNIEIQTGQYAAGMYKIGTDMPSGTYLVTGDTGYVEVSSDASGELDSVLTNDTFSKRTYITVSDGQYLQFDGIATPVDDAPAYEAEDGYYPEGKYLVGKDIPAGEYNISVTDNNDLDYGYVEIASDASGSVDSIISSENIETNVYRTVEDGQFLKMVGAEIKG